MWAIVIFVKENSVECVPLIWLLDNDNCYWPPYKGSKLKSAISICEEPDDSWNIFKVRRINENKNYDDLLQARASCEMAQYYSDISDMEGGEKRKSKKKVFSDSSSEDEYSENLGVDLPTIPEGFASNPLKCQTQSNNNINIKKKPTTDSHQKKKFNKSIEPQGNNFPSCNVSQEHSSPQKKADNNEFEVQVLRKLAILNVKLDQISSDLFTLQETIISMKQVETELNKEVSDVNYPFPLENMKAVEEFEISLQKNDNYKSFVSFLERIGGNTEYDSVKRVYSRIFTNEVATLYNWKGFKNKKSFGSLLVAKATVEAILKNRKLDNTTETKIENAIKTWLRHAKDRMKDRARTESVE